MARQGKMYSSPFHIETATYKYAIEHETDDCYPQSISVDCKHIVSNRNCRLWNSGFAKCASFKCRCYQKTMQRAGANCSLCAFYFEKKCHNPHRPPKEKISTAAALYCCFYICEADDSVKYHQIARHERRIYLTSQLDLQKKAIARRQKQIINAEKEMVKLDSFCAEYAYLQNKIIGRKKALQQAETIATQIQSGLAALGGELREQPAKNIKKAKKGKSSQSKNIVKHPR